MEYTVAALEERTASRLDICVLGRARVGMECLSKYEGELGGGCRFFSVAGRGNLVGIEEGLAGGQGEHRKEARIAACAKGMRKCSLILFGV